MALLIYPANTPASFTIPLTDGAGNPVSPVTVTWNVLDEDGGQLNDSAVILNVAPGTTSIEINVPSDLNALVEGQIRGVRVVAIDFDGLGLSTSVSYMVERTAALVVMTNSFQTYERGLVTRAELGQALPAFDSAVKNRQVAALETAFRKLCRIQYKFALSGDPRNYVNWDEEIGVDHRIYRVVRDISLITPDEFAAFTDGFKSALRRAQIVEANAVLGGDPITEKRLSGIVSETVGESSMFLKSAAPLTLPVSRAAFTELTGYVYRRFALARG